MNLGAYSLIGEVEALEDRPYNTTATSGTNETVIYVIPIDVNIAVLFINITINKGV